MARGRKKEELTLEEKLERALVPVEEQPYEVPENGPRRRRSSSAILKPSEVCFMIFSRALASSPRLSEMRMQ